MGWGSPLGSEIRASILTEIPSLVQYGEGGKHESPLEPCSSLLRPGVTVIIFAHR